MDQCTKIISLPEPKKLNSHRWTDEEKVFRRKENELKEIEDLNIPLKTAFFYKLSKSLFGPFFKELNQKQVQDNVLNENKMQILNWQLERYNNHDMNIINSRNIIIKDTYNLLKKAVNDCEVIEMDFLEKNLDSLFLDCSFIKEIDQSLQNFQNIQILSLCGNYIKDIAGSFLPRSLKHLELFHNLISNLRSLTRYAPKTILHLGLGRNRLTNGSNLHLLSKSRNFTYLKSLDLSDNDIYSLKCTLISLNDLTSLTAISLEGNPCSVIPDYRAEVVTTFPSLQYLDLTQILEEDKVHQEEEFFEKSEPQIIFQCFRLMGLPEPPKDSKNTQVFYIEANFPLLLENTIDAEKLEDEFNKDPEDELEDINENKIKEKTVNHKNEEGDKNKGKNKKEKSNKKEETPKKGKKKSYYAGENEYDEKFESHNMWFKSERLGWSKIMEFPPVLLSAPENKLELIRDNFRSIVPVRIVYLKIAPYSTKNKNQKSKDQSKKDKKSKHATKEEIDDHFIHTENTSEEKQTEIVLKKITLASFYCELKSVNWSDETVDFYWVDHEDIGKKALRINGSLKAIDYDVLNDNKKAKEKTRKVIDGSDPEAPKKELVPTILTCQVGFGLKRLD